MKCERQVRDLNIRRGALEIDRPGSPQPLVNRALESEAHLMRHKFDLMLRLLKCFEQDVICRILGSNILTFARGFLGGDMPSISLPLHIIFEIYCNIIM